MGYQNLLSSSKVNLRQVSVEGGVSPDIRGLTVDGLLRAVEAQEDLNEYVIRCFFPLFESISSFFRWGRCSTSAKKERLAPMNFLYRSGKIFRSYRHRLLLFNTTVLHPPWMLVQMLWGCSGGDFIETSSSSWLKFHRTCEQPGWEKSVLCLNTHYQGQFFP